MLKLAIIDSDYEKCSLDDPLTCVSPKNNGELPTTPPLAQLPISNCFISGDENNTTGKGSAHTAQQISGSGKLTAANQPRKIDC